MLFYFLQVFLKILSTLHHLQQKHLIFAPPSPALSLKLNKQHLLRFSGKIQILRLLNIHPSQEFQRCGREL